MAEHDGDPKERTDVLLSRRRLLHLPDGWTSLDAATLGTEVLKGAAVPAALAYVGLEIGRIQRNEQSLLSRRVDSYDEVAGPANDIVCFIKVVGHWRSLDPEKIVAAKRIVDRRMWIDLGVWSDNVWSRYENFMRVGFSEYSGVGRSALIRASPEYLQREMGVHFQESWRNWLDSQAPPSTARDILQAYMSWMYAFRREMGGTT